MAEWQTRDRTRSAALARPPDKRDSQAEANNVARRAVIDSRIGAIDERLAQDFPDYAVFARSAPLAIEEVQANLREDEALVFFLDTPQWDLLPEETLIWVVTKHEVRWTHSQIGTAFLTREVAALRCGLDAAAWLEAGARCAEALGRDSARVSGGALPFDHDRSHRLYKALFGAVEDLIAGKRLLVVPSGPLTQLPFHVLVTEPPTSPDHRAAAWLVRRHALAVLPSVSALKALRRIARPSAATRAMVGVGNPLLDGPAGQYTEAARLAPSAQDVPSRTLSATDRSNRTTQWRCSLHPPVWSRRHRTSQSTSSSPRDCVSIRPGPQDSSG